MAGTTVTLGITDQLAMHYLLEEGVGLIEATPDDPHILWLRNHTLRLHTLPVLSFPSGHVAFVQRLPQRRASRGGGRGHSCRRLAVAELRAGCEVALGFAAAARAHPGTEHALPASYPASNAPPPPPPPTLWLQARCGTVRGACHLPALPKQHARRGQAGAVQVCHKDECVVLRSSRGGRGAAAEVEEAQQQLHARICHW